MAIKFYRERAMYGCFSNFSKHPMTIESKEWMTVEHYFQAQKFLSDADQEAVRLAKSPMDAKNIGNERDRHLRDDWELVKDDVMRRAVRQKFTEHQDIREVLLSTGDHLLIENAPNDYYWGCGANGTGKNMLGQILVEVREELRKG